MKYLTTSQKNNETVLQQSRYAYTLFIYNKSSCSVNDNKATEAQQQDTDINSG